MDRRGEWTSTALAEARLQNLLRAATDGICDLENQGLLQPPGPLPHFYSQTIHIPIYPVGADSRTTAPIAWTQESRRTLATTPEERFAGDADRDSPCDSFNPDRIAEDVAEQCRTAITVQEGRDWPALAHRLGLDPHAKGVKARAQDTRWWRRRIKQTYTRAMEAAYCVIDPEHLEYASPVALRMSAMTDERATRFAETHDLEADNGQVRPMDFAAPENSERCRHAELAARAFGIATLAERSGRSRAALITLTCPGRLHRTTTAGGGLRRANPHWDGTLPIVAEAFLQKRWARVRAAAKREHILKHFVVSTQPNKDGTPHWHIITFFKDKQELEQIAAVLTRYYKPETPVQILEVDDPEDKERPHQIQIKILKGGALGGLRYILRALQYIGRGVMSADAGGADGAENERVLALRDEATRITAWARALGIRRFRTSHSKATIWRLLRRGDLDVSAAGPAAAQAQAAARAPDFATFITAIESAGIKIAMAPSTNRYGEPAQRVAGVRIGNVVYTPERYWQPVRKVISGAASDSPRTVSHKYQEKTAARIEEPLDAAVARLMRPQKPKAGHDSPDPNEEIPSRSIESAPPGWPVRDETGNRIRNAGS